MGKIHRDIFVNVLIKINCVYQSQFIEDLHIAFNRFHSKFLVSNDIGFDSSWIGQLSKCSV